MSKHELQGTEAWVEKISEHELPALAATVRNLEKMASNDTASLASLGQSVLHDQGLTSRILRVVNSVSYGVGRNRVTTVSRAAVILGYNTLKHICITAKMIDSMLRNRDISKPVHKRLLRLMAKSFHAAMLARVLVGEHDEDTQEEVYIAALLHELGEIAFWSMGGGVTERLDEALTNGRAPREKISQEILGTTFDKISAGLARSWNMGDMLVRSIEDPNRRTPEMRAIELASNYSQALTDPNAKIDVQMCLSEMAELVGVPIPGLKRRIKKCTQDSVELAVSYGAESLTEFLDPEADVNRFSSDEAPHHLSDEVMQLKMLRELTQLSMERADLNLLVNTAIEGLHRGVGMDRVIVLMVNQKKDKLTPRFVSCANAGRIETGFVFPLTSLATVFDDAYNQQLPFWVDKPESEQWRQKVTPALRGLCEDSAFFVAPLAVNGKCLGVVYSDRAETERPLSSDDFGAFNHFTGQLSLCLSLAIR
ncbi:MULTISPECIES: HDOD domain-containing protein [Corallincola]|uniref:HDOD domain-containing protein n=3 Tax=Corallincola TaxID=1775176 RepID=A0A368NH60_9GAMM|nr:MULTISPECIES: HDOD domain-containing protein [Corallincola]RCU49223.1 HDOD domain-containing protein [Corallincola holothuriorum]TAA47477.1 HDOD domain-containing protein [Corallincola spongiicola]TCI05156.1 HDOD domain-containing protein [Corallincola luteus]